MTRSFAPKRANSIYRFELKDASTLQSLSTYDISVRSSGIDLSRVQASIRSDQDLDLSSLRYYGRDGQITDLSLTVYDALTGNRLTNSPINVDLTANPRISNAIFKKSGSYTVVMRTSS